METFVCHELLAHIRCAEKPYRLYHYRDREKREIDFLIEDQKGKRVGIEVKSSSTVQRKDFNHLKWFQETLSTDQEFIGLVLYTGSEVVPFGKRLWAVPISRLWGLSL